MLDVIIKMSIACILSYYSISDFHTLVFETRWAHIIIIIIIVVYRWNLVSQILGLISARI